MHVELVQVAGAEPGRRWRFPPGERVIIGRGDEVQVRLRDPDASRAHAEVTLTPTGVRVVDLGSRNGTFLGDVQLPAGQPRVAARGDRLRIGAHVLALEVVVDPASAPREPPMRERYEVVRLLGEGGGGTVHLARHRATGTPVAIKTLHPQLTRDPDVRARFLREGSVRLRHPNLVQVLEAVEEEGRLHLVMELVTGGSAADLAKADEVPVATALRVCADAARGLAALHAAGIVHRDVKPANILLTAEGRAKLGDFGLAKQVGAGATLTATGQGMGTLAYVAPEQAQDAKRITPAADLYSLGASLYCLLSGRPPFVTTTLEVLVEIITAPPPPIASLRPDCPPAVAEVVHALLAKDADERPPTAVYVARELDRLAGS